MNAGHAADYSRARVNVPSPGEARGQAARNACAGTSSSIDSARWSDSAAGSARMPCNASGALTRMWSIAFCGRQFMVRSGVSGTPTIVVNGKYRVTGGRTYQDVMQITDRLIQKARAEAGGAAS